ncbi:MAG: monovalent cation:proton antiporter-2 (CPA2) family protein [Rickettsiales bacterium]|nr:monovalent cation:proton antiporter-2 (CPA2) family protein [Rickettsiales bacterium]
MHAANQLLEAVILLCAAVLIVAIFRAIRLSPVLGYLAAGTIIGPFGFSFIRDTTTTAGFAEFGIIFLLFLIGLELSLERLRSMRTHVFGFGGAQLIITIGAFTLFFASGISDQQSAIIIAGGLALSSTAIVLQVINEQGEKASRVGRLALAVLILQDLAVIPLLVFVSIVGSGEEQRPLIEIIGDVVIKASLCIATIFIAGHFLLRPLFRFIASLDHTELFTATTLFVVLGVSALTHYAGLSPALGAFMAGLLVAETEFKTQVEADILPFKGLFLGLFFMTVGMSLNLDTLLNSFMSIIGLTIALMACKAIIIIALGRIFDFSMGTALHVGLLLSQGSEFGFVLFTLADTKGLLDHQLSQILLVVITISMALTPMIASLGKRLSLMLEKNTITNPSDIVEETLDLSNHVIISGFGRVGHTVARLLESENINYVAIDMDSFLVAKERKNGIPVYFGDTARVHVLNALGINRARALIITHNDTRVALQTIATIREINPELPIIARAKNIEQVQKLEKAGADLAVAEMFEVSLQMGGALLKALAVNEYEISRIIDMFRAEDYMLTRSAEKEVSAPN